MRFLIFISFSLILISCKNQQAQERLKAHTININKSLEEVISYNTMNFNLAAFESEILNGHKRDLQFYSTNTYSLINKENREPDSLIYWRLTKSQEARKYNFNSTLDSALVFSNDTLARQTALLLNLNEYIRHINSSFSFCGIIFGSTPIIDSKDSSIIKLYGVPPKGSELDILLRHTKSTNKTKIDTTNLWATLKIKQ